MTNKVKKVPAPRLRFPGFEGEWEAVKLKNISTPITEKVGNRKLTPVSISAGIGFVPQTEKFGRDISGAQYKLYTVVRDGEFVFNKGNSKTYPEGAIYLLEGWGEVAAPNVFISFRLKAGYVNDFYRYVFEKNTHGDQLRPHITSGARSNGLLNISKETFFDIELPTTSTAEQTHIAAALSSLDAVIAAHQSKLEALRQHKRGLMAGLFPAEGEKVPHLRFPEFEDSGGWVEKKLGLLLTVSNGRDYKHLKPGNIPVYGTGGYMLSVDDYLHDGESVTIGRKGTIDRPTLLSGKFWAVDTLFYTHSYKNTTAKFIFYVFQQINWQDYNAASGVPSLTKSTIDAIEVPLPALPEQQHIAACLSSLDDLMTAQQGKIAALQKFKRGLMQGLFPNNDDG